MAPMETGYRWSIVKESSMSYRCVILGLLVFMGGCALTVQDVREMGAEGDVPGLMDAYRSAQEEAIQIAAVEELGGIGGSEADSLLLQAAKSPYPKVRAAALNKMKALLDLDLVFNLATTDFDQGVRRQAERLLLSNANGLKDKCISFSHSSDYRERALCARMLGKVNHPDSISRLLTLGKRDKNSEVRRNAVISLGDLAVVKAKSLLYHLKWRDPDPGVNVEAERVLSRFSPPVFDVRIAVAPLDNNTGSRRHKNIGFEFAQVISAAIEKEKVCHMVERAKINQAIRELKFGLSDMADENAACELGKFLTAQQVVYGAVHRDGQEYTVVVQRMDVETLKILQSVMDKAYEADLGQLKTRVAEQFIRTFQWE